MLTLIAESKTMSSHQRAVTHDQWLAHRPLFEEDAQTLCDHLHLLRQEDLCRLVGVSVRQSRQAQMYLYEFADKMTGLPALEAFTGVVFHALGVDSLTQPDLNFADANLRVVSSMYGLLRPSDIIKPYRLDYAAKVAPGSRSLASYWKQRVTAYLLQNLSDSGEEEILDLLPKEASKCIDWKNVRRYARVVTVEFRELTGPDIYKTPNSNRLKELRGRMLREIITRRIENCDVLKRLASDHYLFASEEENGEVLRFLA